MDSTGWAFTVIAGWLAFNIAILALMAVTGRKRSPR